MAPIWLERRQSTPTSIITAIGLLDVYIRIHLDRIVFKSILAVPCCKKTRSSAIAEKPARRSMSRAESACNMNDLQRHSRSPELLLSDRLHIAFYQWPVVTTSLAPFPYMISCDLEKFFIFSNAAEIMSNACFLKFQFICKHIVVRYAIFPSYRYYKGFKQQK